MEHIGQSSQEHAPGPFDIAEYLAPLRPVAYLGAVPAFPVVDEPKEIVSVSLGANLGYLEEDLSQLSGIRGLGVAPAPGQPLTLDMYETALDRHIGPELPEDLHHTGVAINGKATRTQSIPCQTLKERQELRLRSLRDPVFTSEEGMSPGLHQGNKTAGTMKEGPVEDEALASQGTHCRRRGRLPKIVTNHAVKLPGAVPALAGQLPDRVTFDDPAPEPFLLSRVFRSVVAPTERVSATATEPALSATNIDTIPLDPVTPTVGAAFFCLP